MPLVLLLLPLTAAAAQPIMLVDSPRGGELYTEGSTQTVRILTRGRVKTIAIELSRDGGTTYAAVGTIDNMAIKDPKLRNMLAWTVSGPSSATCLVRASTADNDGNLIQAVSSRFVIGTVMTNDEGITSIELVNGSVATLQIADGSVTTQKLADHAVTSPKVGSGTASSGMVLQSDGIGGAAWAIPSGAGSVSADAGNSLVAALNDPATTTRINASALTGTGSINITGNAATATTATGVAAGAGNSVVAALNDPATTTKVNASVLTGTAAINITGHAATATNFTGNLAGDVTGPQTATVVTNVGGQTAANVAAGVQAANAATNANTADAIVKRDASGNFSAGTITATLNGNATTATSAGSAPPSGAAGGDLSGTYPNPTVAQLGAISGANLTNLNASNIASGMVPVANLPIAGTTAGTRGAVYADGTTITVAGDGKLTAAGGAPSGAAGGDLGGTYPNPTVATVGGETAANLAAGAQAANAATNTNTASTIVKRDASGNFTAGWVYAGAVIATMTGTGNAGSFEVNNASNGTFALRATSNGSGRAFGASQTGTGEAGWFTVDNAASGASALVGSTTGTGNGVAASINNATGAGAALRADTNGTGWAVYARTTGTGPAGSFTISNATNNDRALYAGTNGTGAAFVAENTGTSSAGLFQVLNAGNSAGVLRAVTSGTGDVLVADHNGASGNIAVFQSGGVTKATIDKSGNASFNGVSLSATATRYYAISHRDFTQDVTDAAVMTREDTGVIINTSGRSLRAPLHLPHGAVITELRAVVLDNEAATDVQVALERNLMSDGALETIQAVATSGTSASRQTLTGVVLSHVVDNQNYTYAVKGQVYPGAANITSVRITYTVVSPLP